MSRIAPPAQSLVHRGKVAPRSYRLGLAAVTAMLLSASLLSACGGSSSNIKPDTRTRHNESHITIHQDALEHDPIIGWAVENGTPNKNTLHDEVRFLAWSALNAGAHSSRCVITVSKLVTDQPDEDPMEDDPEMLTIGDLGNPKPSLEQAYIIPCSERANSTRIAWPHDAIVLIGHIAEPNTDDSNDDNPGNNRWHFVIEEVTQTPRTTQIDDPRGSLKWATPLPSPKPEEIARRLRPEGRACFSALQTKGYDRAASSCAQAADDFAFASNHVSSQGAPSDVATLAIVSSLYRKAQSLALHMLGDDTDSKDAFYKGRDLLRAIYVTPGCTWCEKEAKKSLKKYGEWPPRNYDV